MGMSGTWKIANLERIMYYVTRLSDTGEIFLNKIESIIGENFNGSPSLFEKWIVDEALSEAKQIEESPDAVNWRRMIVGPFKFRRFNYLWFLEGTNLKGCGIVFPDFDYLEGEVKVLYGDKKLKYEKFIGFKI